MNSKIKRVVAINDMSGLGKCSLTVAIPILATLGLQTCPFPTAILSCQTGYPKYTFFDFTDEMIKYEKCWEELHSKFNCIYSGFLGSERQIDIVANFIQKHKEAMIFVDPVMGDNGEIYGTYNDEMCYKMKELVKIADIVTPNLTEACILTGLNYENIKELSLEDIKSIAMDIGNMGPEKIVITGIVKENIVHNLAYDKEKDEIFITEAKYNQRSYSGTGDIFSSIVCGMTVRGIDFTVAVQKASNFIEEAIDYTDKFDIPGREGICYEFFLKELIINE
ncbi:pyridoxine kinase [Clostridium collagenovorans DSM 3089]|uniref:pyridoxal kinase n=1 Tax=Clostridium collagenovorans DSM 3089 TaxID=1121306 RepID=A0A1M5T8W0_9CLOT|nr:pyridoxamine kinase [Clostridium collagenovorans]SHH47207.1 pyridoxine kinase [Clostridium collagenovorans DSM 3089]